ncbi:MAG TPA: ATP-binding protein [Candidatus Methylomirabilis sp.]|nr:ATP-binding protein [Candidatus Methylomirabilis sp.]
MARSTFEPIWEIVASVALLMCVATLAPAADQSSLAAEEAASLTPRDDADSRKPERYVLLLYSEARLTPSVVDADQALRSTLKRLSSAPVHFYTEFLDLNSYRGTSFQDELHDLLRLKYWERRIDLIVGQGQLTVPFALKFRAELFPSVPIVFVGVECSTFADSSVHAVVTGTWRRRAWGETLDLARRLHPRTRRAVVIVGSSRGEQLWLDDARQQLAGYAGSIDISYLIDRSFEDVVRAVAAVPNDTVVLAGPFLRDGTGRDVETPDLIDRMVAVTHVPIYALTEGAIGKGVVGGYVVSFEAHGRTAAELSARVLAGERPPPTAEGTTVAKFDERQIKRWGIERRLLPAASVVLFHEPSVWERYGGYIIGVAGLLLVQSAFIATLLVQRAQRRRAQRSLAERLRFETLLSDLSRALASCSDAAIDREVESGLRRIVEDLGTDRASLWELDDRAGEARLTHSWTRPGIPPGHEVSQEKQFPWIFSQIRQGRVVRLPLPENLTDETLTDRQGLAQDPARSTAIAPLVEGGTVVGGLSVGTVLEERHWPDELVPRLRLLADIFANALARQRAARAARESEKDIRILAGRLITAQEEERRRIARDLHDGVNQDLAALSIALAAIEDGLPEGTPIGRRQEFARLQARAVELAEAIRHLSHELHPGVLQYAGLTSALRSHCREFEREHGLPVTYRADDDLGAVPPDIALCLYRVTQEALKNAARHAKAGQVWVSLARGQADLVLTIRDDGGGFDLEEVWARGGLGLISLDERVRLVGGRLAIDTKPRRGTEIHVVVPLPASGVWTSRAD